ncbi:DUF4149 domain-containing protein [Nitrospira sp. NS4]|uniref:DUF4149 domain-containing protein n=1 Tax=Nitrospira sp. NS4 TaxID=3414498 RepID=UPI003C2CACF1
MEDTILYLHSLAIAVLIGKVVLLSFVVAPVLAKQLDREPFGKVVRELFPAYYALGMGAAAIGVLSVLMLGIIHETNVIRHLTAGVWLVVLAAETYCRSPLTPRSNAMRDRIKEQESQGPVDPVLQAAWNRLHQRSVYLNSLVLLGGLCLLGLAGRW